MIECSCGATVSGQVYVEAAEYWNTLNEAKELLGNNKAHITYLRERGLIPGPTGQGLAKKIRKQTGEKPPNHCKAWTSRQKNSLEKQHE